MEQQHPIPQQISSYQFRLVGDMTLKQFFQIAAGALVSLLFYASPLHPIIKWPAVIFFAILGVALAFFPLEERPLEVWILAFFRSIYSPTIFNWQKSAKPQTFFQEEAPVPTEKIIAPKGEAALEEYLATTTHQKEGFLAKLEGAEASFLSRLTQIIGGFTPAPAATAQPPISKPPSGPSIKEGLNVPQGQPVEIRGVVAPKAAPQTIPTSQVSFTKVTPIVGSSDQISGQAAQFSLEASPPIPPSAPNLVVGQIFDSNGKIVEGAIMEIRDSAGRPARALKSNKLGHFLIVTPLVNGTYQITIEKEGYEFDPVTFEAKGEVIPPIAIRAKARTNSQSPAVNYQPAIT